ncbi:MAG: glycosyltransferase [Clostridium sp.]|nr:glycosyltransferase [Clostridium sp.]
MKKKVFIMMSSLGIGGVESALISMLSCFDYTKYSVDLFLFNHSGENMTNIPEEVNLLPEIKAYSGLEGPITKNIKTMNWGVALGRITGKFTSKLYNRMNHWNDSSLVSYQYSHKFSKFFLPKIMPDKEYDLAISFLTPHYFVAEKVTAKKKIAWIHTDYSTMHCDTDSELKMWNKYDNIISISDKCTSAFCSKFPDLKNKIVLIENITKKEIIFKKAESEKIVLNDKGISLLSVGRFSYPKNFDNVPEIASLIKAKGIDFKWYIVGDGGEEPSIRSKIAEYKMEDTVILLGKKENPYPYIKACDIYVQPSRYEGKAVTVCEALVLNKPVVITNYSTAHSQVKNGFDGVIVPMDNEGCANALADVMTGQELLHRLIENMKATNYSNESEIEKLYELLED